MPRWLLALALGAAPIIWACNDELVDDVPKTVCLSGKQWIGEKRGSPNMYPGRDCVGCHLENDGPELMFGGTVYPYVEFNTEVEQTYQTGEDCFGVEGVTVTIEGGDGQIFEVVTNEAGNFYLEGKASDLVKPFTAKVNWISQRPENAGEPREAQMAATRPSYGGCARCHGRDPMERFPPADAPDDLVITEDQRVAPIKKIGLPGEVTLAEEFGDL